MSIGHERCGVLFHPIWPSLTCDQALPCLSVSEFQEEGMNAINLPLSPISFELDPEDTMLGNCPSCLWNNLVPIV